MKYDNFLRIFFRYIEVGEEAKLKCCYEEGVWAYWSLLYAMRAWKQQMAQSKHSKVLENPVLSHCKYFYSGSIFYYFKIATSKNQKCLVDSDYCKYLPDKAS